MDGVSVIMVSYWTGSVLFAAIEAVLNQGQNGVVELILIDNGNPLAVTMELAQRAEAEPRLKFVSGHGNVGFSRGCNMGANRARGRYLLLLNPDCCLGIGTISGLAGRSRGAWRPLDARRPCDQPRRERSAWIAALPPHAVHCPG